MTAYTMSELSTPSGAHTGLQVAAGVLTISSTTTAASTVALCRVPDGCTIVDWTMFFSDTEVLGGANQRVDIGTSLSPSALGHISMSGTAGQANAGHFKPHGSDDLLPARVSLTSSDNTGEGSRWLVATFDVAPSTSGTVLTARFWVTYTNDGLTGHKTIA